MTPEEATNQIVGFLHEVQARNEVPRLLAPRLLAMREALLVALGLEFREALNWGKGRVGVPLRYDQDGLWVVPDE